MPASRRRCLDAWMSRFKKKTKKKNIVFTGAILPILQFRTLLCIAGEYGITTLTIELQYNRITMLVQNTFQGYTGGYLTVNFANNAITYIAPDMLSGEKLFGHCNGMLSRNIWSSLVTDCGVCFDVLFTPK